MNDSTPTQKRQKRPIVFFAWPFIFLLIIGICFINVLNSPGAHDTTDSAAGWIVILLGFIIVAVWPFAIASFVYGTHRLIPMLSVDRRTLWGRIFFWGPLAVFIGSMVIADVLFKGLLSINPAGFGFVVSAILTLFWLPAVICGIMLLRSARTNSPSGNLQP